MDNLASGWFIICTDRSDDLFQDTVMCKKLPKGGKVNVIESFFEVYESDVQRRNPLQGLFNDHS